ncbi:MAG: group 1 glycosyl transferase [Parcubacteria group bacterium Gr01-1014_18]|nr:MAG: group 1 glycosyl transferase [Parcubacteria group bacterium Greene0416_36]TSC80140.1 MAG: group 1 glycosyl transferase [Parcubacteria group bacterium Gr01-1014_18]TSC99354.1 MAG: group 1 glycosyl transferase [Parcubacteria group bacterium Greene1014_20]TSD06809.1 MAG: group 1 glycosyl transferase [Parcubacteria group bacterium Greene0714_2]
MSRNKADHLWVGQVLPIGTAAWILHKIMGIRYSVFTHGMDIVAPQSNPRKKKLLQMILRSADEVVANSLYTKTELIKLGVSADEIRIIYPGVDPEEFVEPRAEEIAEFCQKYGLEGKRVIAGIGRLVERKGFQFAILALKNVAAKYPNAVLVLGGEGVYGQTLKCCARDQFGDDYSKKIIFCGTLNIRDRACLYSLCEFFVTPSVDLAGDIEGFGMVYLEAAMYGKPSIGGNSGGVPEAVISGETGYIVEGRDISSLSGAMMRLLGDPEEARRMGERARERVMRDFTWEKLMKHHKSQVTNYK